MKGILLFPKRFQLLILTLLIGIGTLGLVIFRQNNELRETSGWIRHKEEVLFQTEKVLSSAKDIQIATRGYALTSDSSFIPRILQKQVEIDLRLSKLRSLTKDNPSQLSRLDTLQKLLVRRVVLSLSTVERVKAARQNEVLNIFRTTREGEQLMSEISLLVHRFRVEEESLLGQRRSANFKSAILLNRITIGLLALAAIIIALGYYLALRYLAYKKRVDARIQALNAMLEEKLQAKTAEATELTEQYNFVLENLLEGAFLLNFDYRYLYANQSFLKRFNWSKTGTIGRTFMSKHPGIEHHILFGLIQRCIEDRTPVRTETEFDALNGDKRYYDTSIQPIPQGVIILSNDITDRKKESLKM